MKLLEDCQMPSSSLPEAVQRLSPTLLVLAKTRNELAASLHAEAAA
jgi:hypothetical protein